MKIKDITSNSFQKYGKILQGYQTLELLNEMKNTPLPENVIYVASVEELENLPLAEEIQNRTFGGMPIQIGYCNGNNKKLNAVEYHRSSEINLAATDIILMLGMQQDIDEEYHYQTDKIEAFYVPKGTMIELYATTLHYAPCTAKENGFRCVVILPKGTNEKLTFSVFPNGEDKLLAARNKWLIAHEEAAIDGAFCGLIGENITLE